MSTNSQLLIYHTPNGNIEIDVRLVMDALLDKYASEGIENIEELNVLKVEPFTHLGTPAEIVGYFGGRENYLKALKELEQEIYKTAA